MSENNLKTWAEVKSNPVAGTMFLVPETGAQGTILEGKFGGKTQVELSCTEPGCTEKHIRLSSDVHQCGKCPTHGKKKGSRGPSVVTGALSNDPEVQRALQLLEAAKAATKAKLQAEREAKKAEKKVVTDEQRIERAKAKKVANIKTRFQAAMETAAKYGATIAPELLAEAASVGLA